ncbi:hypothetical protein C7974DRAFT_277440, partial [Boeremia exigua]|uniref:uncharacterized protein n=1 Tax=Boeremia exigua TaxID=749465 RepID=UPI001E8CFD8E
NHAEPPQYYDSEPTSQPPQYLHNANRVNRTEPASAANISAILAYPSGLDLEAEKRSWRERWRDWKARN